MLTQHYLQEILHYDPLTGIFVWLRLPAKLNHLQGKPAGSQYANGYNYIDIENKSYRCGRLAWLYVHGYFPADYVEHKDTNKGNDRIGNLRLATNSLNQANRGPPSNNTSGVKGVRFEADRNRWRAQIVVNGHSKNLGRYHTREEAMYAYAIAAEKAWGEFAKAEMSRL